MSQNDPINNDSIASGAAARDVDRARDAGLVGKVRAGDPDAFGQLYDVWFDRVFNVALRILRNRDTAAEISQDAFLSAWRSLDSLADPASFGGWVLRITRNAALNRAERDQRATAVDQDGLAVIERAGMSPVSAPQGFDVGSRVARHENPAVAADDAEIVALVQETAASLGARDAEVLDLQLRFQLSPAEVGEVLGLNRNAANQLCHRVRARFANAFGARMLWAGGRPKCSALRTELTAAVGTGFDADKVAAITRHAEHCTICEEDRRTRLSPTALFGGIALVPALLSVRTSVAHGLAEAGVPMGGSSVVLSPQQVAGGEASSSEPAATSSDATSTTSDGGETSTLPLRGGPSRRVLAVLGAAAAIVALIAFVFMGRGDDSTTLMASRVGSTTQPAAAQSRTGSSTTAGAATVPALPPGPGTSTRPVVAPPATPTTLPLVPTTTVLGPTVEEFTVTPDTPQPAVYSMTTGPVLSWNVEGATDVTIWRWLDDGVNGTRQMQVEATGPAGSKQLCPGSPVAGGGCAAPSGRYHFELIATGVDGTTFTSPLQPGFSVAQPIID